MGPRVNGGGWLTIGGQAVDWIYRDLDDVDACWRRARRGEVVLHIQVGHPAGFPEWAYQGCVWVRAGTVAVFVRHAGFP